MKLLSNIYPKYARTGGNEGEDKGTTHSYIEAYDNLLAPYQKSAQTVLEIGVSAGLSIQMWCEYFERALIIGVDKNLTFFTDHPRIELWQADTTSLRFSELLTGFLFDVVIDDGEHIEATQIKIFETLRKHMRKDSIYIIEDVAAPNTAQAISRMHPETNLIDLTHIKGRGDDRLIVCKF